MIINVVVNTSNTQELCYHIYQNNYCSSVELQEVSLDKKLLSMELNVSNLQSDVVEDIGNGAAVIPGHTHSEPW